MKVIQWTPTAPTQSNVAKYRKERHYIGGRTLVAADNAVSPARVIQLADVRFYFNQKGDGMNPVYCYAWVYDGRLHGGGGKAGGCGYHKPSAAFEAATQAAGITFDKNIAGAGETAIDEALLALGEFLGYEQKSLLVIHNHG